MMNEAVAKGAVCLDGSPGGYYIRPGTPNNSRWVVFHQVLPPLRLGVILLAHESTPSLDCALGWWLVYER